MVEFCKRSTVLDSILSGPVRTTSAHTDSTDRFAAETPVEGTPILYTGDESRLHLD
jgi:hypothetical protein